MFLINEHLKYLTDIKVVTFFSPPEALQQYRMCPFMFEDQIPLSLKISSNSHIDQIWRKSYLLHIFYSSLRVTRNLGKVQYDCLLGNLTAELT